MAAFSSGQPALSSFNAGIVLSSTLAVCTSSKCAYLRTFASVRYEGVLLFFGVTAVGLGERKCSHGRRFPDDDEAVGATAATARTLI